MNLSHYWTFFITLFFLSCSAHTDRIQFLQNQLVDAELALLRDQAEVDRLRMQLYDEELTFIETRIGIFEKNPPASLDPVLFKKDRETLHRIIQTGPFAVRATDLLDRILFLITQVSDANN